MGHPFYLQSFFEGGEISRKILDFFSLSANPKLIHYFLADMVAKGHTILNTNFVNLIEKACMQYNIPADQNLNRDQSVQPCHFL